MSLIKKTVINRYFNDRGDTEPYLIRWSLLTLPWFAIKLHKILVSDEECLHDHPWSFLSIILKGGYTEEAPWMQVRDVRTEPPLIYARTEKKWYPPGSFLWRPSPWPHRLEVTEPCWTLVVTFKRTREWGFFTKFGWIPWFKYNHQTHC